jgi:hypothetical protein
MALLFMSWGGVTPAPELGTVARVRRFCARAARTAALGDRSESVVDVSGEGVRRRMLLKAENIEEESGRRVRNSDYIRSRMCFDDARNQPRELLVVRCAVTGWRRAYIRKVVKS